MQNKKIVRYVQSLVMLPLLSVSVPAAPVTNPVDNSVVLEQQNMDNIGLPALLAFKKEEGADLDPKAEMFAKEAVMIDAYFASKDMPLEGSGMTMAIEADKNGIDWRLLPAISVRESTGGKNACKKAKNNFFGWGSCKISFNSREEAIAIVAKNLGGNNPKTEMHYSGKTTKEILVKYNPPSIVPHYADQVISIMNTIGPENIAPENNSQA